MHSMITHLPVLGPSLAPDIQTIARKRERIAELEDNAIAGTTESPRTRR